EDVGEGLEAVCERALDVDRRRVGVADVSGERLAAPGVEHDDARGALEADEEIVLAALVVVQPPDDAPAREREVRLPDRLRQLAVSVDLGQPAAFVLEPAERNLDDALHQSRFTSFARTKSFTS